MQTQTVFKAGNSTVVAIPKELSEELQIKPGEKVKVLKSTTEDALIIKKVSKDNKTSTDKKFKKWWNTFLKENAEILDELAVR